MIELIHALHAAAAVRDEAAREHGENVRALDLAREKLLAAQAELDRLAQQDQDAIERHARRLEGQVRAGMGGPLPQLVPSDKHLAAEIAARRTHAAASRLIENLEAATQRSADAVAGAESGVHLARGALVGIRVKELTVELEAVRARETELVRLIAVIRPGDPGAAQMPPAAIAAVTNPPSRPTVNSVLGSEFIIADIDTHIGGQPALVEAARAYWTGYLSDFERDPAPAAAAQAA